ncbi:MAG TPA: hypothetical protein VNP92_19265 [Actinophytocola sp.]|nr:hypothetical protein [Actinophytocola sp.]
MRRFLTTTTAIAGMALATTLFGSAPEAAARPDPGGVRSCPEGSVATSATKTYAGVAVPGPPNGQNQGGRNTSDVELNGELVGIGCMKHTGGTATMQFRWSSVGRLQEGTFIYQLIDCTSGQSHTRRMDYETGTKGTSDKAEATFKVNPSRKYRMRISGQGSYERKSDGFSGLAGYWSIAPGAPTKWQSETTCA